MCKRIGGSYICKKCLDSLEYANEIDSYQTEMYSRHFWMFKYEGVIRNKIIDYKFNDMPHIGRAFSQIITNNKRACEYIGNFDYLVPVPISKKRYKERGYNQCDIIAKLICKEIGDIEPRDDIIVKEKNIQRQSGLDKQERAQNVRHAFSIRKYESLEGKKVVILDDIYTTGNTVNECAKMLNMLGCKEIGVFTIAKD